MPNCGQCGESVSVDAQSCRFCGRSFTDAAQVSINTKAKQSASESPTETKAVEEKNWKDIDQAERDRKSKELGQMIIGLLVLFGGGCLIPVVPVLGLILFIIGLLQFCTAGEK